MSGGVGEEPKADLVVTVSETATTFSGATNLLRFDAPSARDIAAQVRKAFGEDLDGARVHVVATPELFAQLEASLAASGARLSFEEGTAAPAFSPAQSPPGEELVLRRPQEDDQAGVLGGRDWAVWAIAAVVAVAAAVCAVAIVATSRSLFGEGGVGEASTSNEAPEATVILERDGLRVELPAGFSLEPDGGRATGLDPDFRLEIAVDELYNLPPEAMAEQLRRDIDADPALEMVASDGPALLYLERPGDGSEVLWKTWAEANRQLFIGCHTRTAPTKVQEATCRMAMDTAVYLQQ